MSHLLLAGFSLGAGIAAGWLAAGLAVTLLFRPRQPVRVLGFTVQGLLPRRGRELALALADSVSADLRGGALRSALASVDWEEEVRALVGGAIDARAAEAGAARGLGAIWGAVLPLLRDAVASEAARAVAGHREALMDRVTERVDLSALLGEAAHRVDLSSLERVARLALRGDLRRLQALGAAAGGLVGLIQGVLLSAAL